MSSGFCVTIPVIHFPKTSFMYGRSVSNRRIEAWWSQLRRRCASWWMEHFKELRKSGRYCDSNPVHVDCLRFCYMDLIRDELHRFARLWNNHRIRPSINCDRLMVSLGPPGLTILSSRGISHAEFPCSRWQRWRHPVWGRTVRNELYQFLQREILSIGKHHHEWGKLDTA